jgi:hypothetical protein
VLQLVDFFWCGDNRSVHLCLSGLISQAFNSVFLSQQISISEKPSSEQGKFISGSNISVMNADPPFNDPINLTLTNKYYSLRLKPSDVLVFTMFLDIVV